MSRGLPWRVFIKSKKATDAGARIIDITGGRCPCHTIERMRTQMKRGLITPQEFEDRKAIVDRLNDLFRVATDVDQYHRGDDWVDLGDGGFMRRTHVGET